MSRVIAEARDIEGLPTPNSVVVIVDDTPPLASLVTSSLGLVFVPGKFLMTNLRARGWDVLGGRVEDGESSEEAMIREVREETGLEVQPIKLLGYQRIRIESSVPKDYPYPVPDSFQVFYLARPILDHGLEGNEETSGAKFWPVEQARSLKWVKTNSELFEEALNQWMTTV